MVRVSKMHRLGNGLKGSFSIWVETGDLTLLFSINNHCVKYDCKNYYLGGCMHLEYTLGNFQPVMLS